MVAGSGPVVRTRSRLAAVALLVALLGAGGGARAAEPARLVRQGDGVERTVALTFDDGWDAGRCETILDILLEHGVPATWFPNEVYVRRDPGLWARIARHHPIGNHTVSHRSLRGLSQRQIRREIAVNEQRLEAVTGKPMYRVLRPPYGAQDRRVRRVAGELGYETLLLWDVDSGDSHARTTDRSVARAASSGGPGSIVLMHCGPAVTPRVLPYVIGRYACAGYRFATVEGLLAGRAGVSARASCPPPPLEAPSDELGEELAGSEWRLLEADTSDGLASIDTSAVVTLRFGQRRISGVAACVVFEVPASVEDGAVTLGRLMRDTSACQDFPAAPPMGGVLETLLQATALRMVDETLELIDDDGRVRLRFRAAAPVGLQGRWSVTAIASSDGGLEGLLSPSLLSVTFGPSGSLRGWGGCGTFVGGYGVNDDRVKAGPVLQGDTPCGDERDPLEARFLAALRSVDRWDLDDGVLRLRDGDGRVLLVLVPERGG